MKKYMLALVGAVTMALALTGGVSAAPATGDETAAPPPPTYGVYVHIDGNDIHLFTTDEGGSASEYSGTISTPGEIRNVALDHEEDGDWAINDGDTLRFYFRTANHEDGLRFTVRDAGRATFRLYRNGHLISTTHIFLNGGVHPSGNPFTLIF